MIQTGIKLQTIVDFLNKNLSIIIVVPAFIGGLWQAIELMNISYSYIRFFSISQIVPDGILILMVFIMILSIRIIVPFIKSLFLEKSNTGNIEPIDDIKTEKNRKSNLIVYTFSFIVFYCIIMIRIFSSRYQINNIIKFNDSIYSYYFYTTLLIYNLEMSYFYAKIQHKKYYKYCNFLIVILLILMVNYFSQPFHKFFITPDNNINIENIKKDVVNKFPNTKQEILYFNDKYIFINIIDKSKKEKVYITKLDNLFE